MSHGIQRSDSESRRALLQRCVGLVVLLCTVVGLLSAPACLRAQDGHGDAAGLMIASSAGISAGAMGGMQQGCADPCCKHSKPLNVPGRKADCTEHCLAASPVPSQDVLAPTAQSSLLSQVKSVAMPPAMVQVGATLRTAWQVDPPLRMVLPLRI